MAVSDRKRVFLSNSITSALELDGVIDWFPCPRFDSQSLFSGILDDVKGGYFSLKPVSEYNLVSTYVQDSLIIKNSFAAEAGTLETYDFLPMGLSAIMRIYNSEIPFIVDIKPTFDYGMINPGVEEVEKGLIFRNPQSKEGIEVLIEGKYKIVEDSKAIVEPGRGYVSLLYSKDLRYGLFSNKGFVYADPYESLEATKKYWQTQLAKAVEVNEFRRHYYRSLAVIIGLTYNPSGGAIAAPTTSLPEIVGKGRNWDYRYVWVRDAAYASEALSNSGLLYKSKRMLSFLISLIDPASKSFDHPLYSIDGTPPRAEETLPWLKGNHGSKPVRVGNEAYMQIQMDSEGDFINALYSYLRHSGDTEFVKENWWAIEAITKWVSRSWREPSLSLWEERSEKHFVMHTKLMDWVAMDRSAKMAAEIGEAGQSREWSSIAASIKTEMLEKGISKERNIFTHYYGGNTVDSSLLTLPLYGFVESGNEIFLNTLSVIEKELVSSSGLLLRYKIDFAGEAAHPFILINTWLSRVYTRLGQLEKAKVIIERIIEGSTDHGLLAEHIDQSSKEPRGNFPQMFAHAGLVDAILEYVNADKFNVAKAKSHQ